MKKYIAIVWLVLLQQGYAAEKLIFFMPANEIMWGIKNFAVADFRHNEQLNTYVSNYLLNTLREHDFYHALDSTEIESIFADTSYTREDLMATDSIPHICELLQVDAIIQGNVTAFELFPDSMDV